MSTTGEAEAYQSMLCGRSTYDSEVTRTGAAGKYAAGLRTSKAVQMQYEDGGYAYVQASYGNKITGLRQITALARNIGKLLKVSRNITIGRSIQRPGRVRTST